MCVPKGVVGAAFSVAFVIAEPHGNHTVLAFLWFIFGGACPALKNRIMAPPKLPVPLVHNIPYDAPIWPIKTSHTSLPAKFCRSPLQASLNNKTITWLRMVPMILGSPGGGSYSTMSFTNLLAVLWPLASNAHKCPCIMTVSSGVWNLTSTSHFAPCADASAYCDSTVEA